MLKLETCQCQSRIAARCLSDPRQHGEGEAHKYDAEFIDEAQDFSKSWFLCSKLALKEPDDGDLLIVGDGSQPLSSTPFHMESGGRERLGRTINTRFDLDKNYRNTREIMRIATEFVPPNVEQTDPEASLQIVRPNPDIALRSGPAPEMLTVSNAEMELQVAVKKILAWRERTEAFGNRRAVPRQHGRMG